MTANANEESDLVKRYPTLFFFLNQPMHFGAALIGVLNKEKAAGKLNNKIAMVSVGDQFGAEMSAGFGAGLKAAGYEIVLQKSYPLGAADLTTEIKEAKASGADTFIAASYPPDTFMLTGTAIAQITRLSWLAPTMMCSAPPAFPVEFSKSIAVSSEAPMALKLSLAAIGIVRRKSLTATAMSRSIVAAIDWSGQPPATGGHIASASPLESLKRARSPGGT